MNEMNENKRAIVSNVQSVVTMCFESGKRNEGGKRNENETNNKEKTDKT